MPILDRIATTIRVHDVLRQHDRIIVAVSGGADSLALLHLLAGIDLSPQLTAIYIDHGLRPLETPRERQTIAANCLALDIPFVVRTVEVRELVTKGKNSPEEAARILRYRALEEARQEMGARLIAVGHTADDQVEEFFIRLLRGSSSRGLSGMKLKRGNIIRPLLFLRKAQLETFLVGRGVAWCLDSSNLDRRFLRNRVRLDLLPLLEEQFNPALRKTVLQSMDILAAEDDFLAERAAEAYVFCTDCADHAEEHGVSLLVRSGKFLTLHPAIRRRIVEKCCWQLSVRPTYDRIDKLVGLIEHGRNGSELHLDDGVRAEKVPEGLRLSRPLPAGLVRGSSPPAPSIRLVIPGPGRYPVAGTPRELVLDEMSGAASLEPAAGELRADPAKISFPLLLRSFLPGEKFYPGSGSGRRKISRFFNDRKIPAKERPAWPVLLCGDRVVALPGLQLDHRFRLLAQADRWLSIRWNDLEK